MYFLSLFTCIVIAFSTSILALTDRKYPTEYWTSCSEFLNHTKFNPERVIGIDWLIFYFWNPRIEKTYNVRFSRPNDMLVDRFKAEVDREYKDKINWTDAELFMETSIDFSALFLKTNISGVYKIIPSLVFELTRVPTLVFAMKLVEPGYLGIENCKYRICYALAPVDKLPAHTELEKAAKSIGFFGHFNRSHIDLPGHQPGMPPLVPQDEHQAGDDMEEDEDLDIEADPDRLQFF